MHTGPGLEDYLKKGLYGTPETKPAERRRFLGTLRERIIIALTSEQLYEGKIYPEIEAKMKAFPQARLLLNGSIRYSYLSPYIQLAKKYRIPFTILKDEVQDTDIGLVLTMNHAINKQEIFITNSGEQKKTARAKKKGVFQKWKRKAIRLAKELRKRKGAG